MLSAYQISQANEAATDSPTLRSRLEQGEVHVFTWSLDSLVREGFRRHCQELLSADETERWSRFHFTRDRDLYLFSRALVRTTLSRYADVAPEAWRFALERNGKPRVASDELSLRRLSFNLSHTQGMAAVAVAYDRSLGIDVECTASAPPMDAMETCFTDAEIRTLDAHEGAQRERRFWSLWTLKESYIKATGLGLSTPLKQFSVETGHDGRMRLAFAPGLPEQPDDWELWQWQASDRHVLALCVRRVESVELTACAFGAVPICAATESVLHMRTTQRSR